MHTNSPQICELQVTGFRRPGRSMSEGLRLELAVGPTLIGGLVGTSRLVKRARDVGVSVGAASRTGREHLRGPIPVPVYREVFSGSGPAPIRASEGLRAQVAMVVAPRPER